MSLWRFRIASQVNVGQLVRAMARVRMKHIVLIGYTSFNFFILVFQLVLDFHKFSLSKFLGNSKMFCRALSVCSVPYLCYLANKICTKLFLWLVSSPFHRKRALSAADLEPEKTPSGSRSGHFLKTQIYLFWFSTFYVLTWCWNVLASLCVSQPTCSALPASLPCLFLTQFLR